MRPTSYPRHPNVPNALSIDEVEPGVTYVTYVPRKKVLQMGQFITAPMYDEEDRWTAQALVGKEEVETTVFLHDAGIAVSGNGQEWTDAVTIKL